MTFSNYILLVIELLHVGNGCEKRWTRFKDHCYFVSQQQVTFAKALAECSDIREWLAALGTTEESDWLILHLTVTDSSHVYIGGTYMMEEGIWRWVNTGTVFKLDHWITSEPEGKTIENCALCHADRQLKWCDVRCANSYGFVCEKNDKPSRK